MAAVYEGYSFCPIHSMIRSTQMQSQKLRLYLHLVPFFGTALSLWTLYGKSTLAIEEVEGTAKENANQALETASIRSVSRISVVLGLSCLCAITSLSAAAHTPTSQINHLRFLFASSFVGSSYFLLSLTLMFRIARDQSVQLPGLRRLSRRLP